MIFYLIKFILVIYLLKFIHIFFLKLHQEVKNFSFDLKTNFIYEGDLIQYFHFFLNFNLNHYQQITISYFIHLHLDFNLKLQ